MNIKNILLILAFVIQVFFITGCAEQKKYIDNRVITYTQDYKISLFNIYAKDIDSFIDTGYCYDVKILGINPNKKIHGYNNDVINGTVLLYSRDNNYGDSNFNIVNTMYHENSTLNYEYEKYKIIVNVPRLNYSKVFFKNAGDYTYGIDKIYIGIEINQSKDKTYDCIFDKKIRTSNNTYEELKGQVCDSYKVGC